jgi:predicted dehydrogenase
MVMIRLGIIGLGWVAKDFALPAIEHTDGLLLVAAADPIAEPEASFTLYKQAEEMLAEAALDAVYVASPNHLHKEHAVLALQHGCHVLCEKPLALTGADAKLMASQAKQSAKHLVCAFDQRHHPAHRAARALIGAGRIGKVTQVRIDYACWVAADFLPDNWRIEQDRSGGGAIIDLAPHGLDLFEFLVGDRLVDLTLFDQRRVHAYKVDDGGVLIGRSQDGVLLSHTVSYNRLETLPRRRLEVIGTAGMLYAENTMGQTPGGSLTLTDREGITSAIAFPYQSPFDAQFEAFRALCQGDEEARDPSEDVRLVSLLEEALEAAGIC